MNRIDIDFYLIERQHAEYIAYADQYRLAKLAVPHQPHARTLRGSMHDSLLFTAHLLSVFGSQLLTWSCVLQTHSQRLAIDANHQSCNS